MNTDRFVDALREIGEEQDLQDLQMIVDEELEPSGEDVVVLQAMQRMYLDDNHMVHSKRITLNENQVIRNRSPRRRLDLFEITSNDQAVLKPAFVLWLDELSDEDRQKLFNRFPIQPVSKGNINNPDFK